MKRREFLGTVAASAALLTNGPAQGAVCDFPPLPKRPLGKTGLELSVIGFAGLVARDSTPEEVDRVVGQSLDMGMNFFDTAASYGNSEEMMAPAIRPHREKIILATKTRERTREGAEAEFNRSCEILGTDHFDMFLVHGIQHMDRDVEPAFAPGGVLDFCLEKKKSGQIRCLGFSAHSNEAALAALDRHEFDFFYYPVSYASWYRGDFGPAVLAKALEKGVPCVSLKALARQHWPQEVPKEDRCAKCWYQPIEDPEEASLAVRWSLSREGVAAILPPGNEALYQKAVALRGNLAPITPDETTRLEDLSLGMYPLFPRPA